MDEVHILSNTQLQYENDMITNAKDAEELKPLIYRWLVEYQNLTKSELDKFDRVTQEAFRAKYILAAKINEILKYRAEERKIDPKKRGNTKLNKNFADLHKRQEREDTRQIIISNIKPNEERGQLEMFLQQAFGVISDVGKRNNLLREIFDNKDSSTSNQTTNMTTFNVKASTSASSSRSYTMHIKPNTNNTSSSASIGHLSWKRRYDSPDTRVLRVVSAEANTDSTNMQSAHYVKPGGRASAVTLEANSTPMQRPVLPTIANGDTYIVIGPNGTKVPTKDFEALSFQAVFETTRKLLSLVFSEKVLAKNILCDEPSPAIMRLECSPKGQLNPKMISDIEYCITSRTEFPIYLIRQVITVKCAATQRDYGLRFQNSLNESQH